MEILSSFSANTTIASEPDNQADFLPNPEGSSAVVQEIQVSSSISSESATNATQDCRFWPVFASTFVTIFLAELGDKTQVSTLLMTAESHAPWVVFAGAATALVTTSLLGVLIGRWLSTRLSPRTLDLAAGLTLAVLAVWLLWDVVYSG